ncbi:hypothetical protein [Aminobacter phage Erebus]|nr:hypothetical protein [Aminobacter phage Erebus]
MTREGLVLSIEALVKMNKDGRCTPRVPAIAVELLEIAQ